MEYYEIFTTKFLCFKNMSELIINAGKRYFHRICKHNLLKHLFKNAYTVVHLNFLFRISLISHSQPKQ